MRNDIIIISSPSSDKKKRNGTTYVIVFARKNYICYKFCGKHFCDRLYPCTGITNVRLARFSRVTRLAADRRICKVIQDDPSVPLLRVLPATIVRSCVNVLSFPSMIFFPRESTCFARLEHLKGLEILKNARWWIEIGVDIRTK